MHNDVDTTSYDIRTENDAQRMTHSENAHTENARTVSVCRVKMHLSNFEKNLPLGKN